MHARFAILSLINVRLSSVIVAITLAGNTAAVAELTGNVHCADTIPVTPLEGVAVVATDLLGFGGTHSTLTDLNGDYSLTVPYGVYQLRLTNVPAGLTFLSPSDGIHIAPSDLPGSWNFILSGCQSTPTGEIGNRVWKDLNCDGIQDLDEPGMPDVAITLGDCAGNVLMETTTDTNGYYGFTELAPGSYSVRFVAPAGYGFSPMNQGGNASLDSDADPQTGATVCIALQESQKDDTWDAGLCRLEAPGVRSQGYWKNHPDDWPVAGIEIGGTTYDKCEAIIIMQLPTKGDKSRNMFEQLVAAKLNVIAGNESNCIQEIIFLSDAWMASNPSPVSAQSPAWKPEGQYLEAQLDAYNNGFLCAPCAE